MAIMETLAGGAAASLLMPPMPPMPRLSLPMANELRILCMILLMPLSSPPPAPPLPGVSTPQTACCLAEVLEAPSMDLRPSATILKRLDRLMDSPLLPAPCGVLGCCTPLSLPRSLPWCEGLSEPAERSGITTAAGRKSTFGTEEGGRVEATDAAPLTAPSGSGCTRGPLERGLSPGPAAMVTLALGGFAGGDGAAAVAAGVMSLLAPAPPPSLACWDAVVSSPPAAPGRRAAPLWLLMALTSPLLDVAWLAKLMLLCCGGPSGAASGLSRCCRLGAAASDLRGGRLPSLWLTSRTSSAPRAAPAPDADALPVSPSGMGVTGSPPSSPPAGWGCPPALASRPSPPLDCVPSLSSVSALGSVARARAPAAGSPSPRVVALAAAAGARLVLRLAARLALALPMGTTASSCPGAT